MPEANAFRPHLTVHSGGTVLSLHGPELIPAGEWSSITAGLSSGISSLEVGGEEAHLIVTTVDAGSGDVLLGEDFTGRIDDLTLFHSSGASPPLLALEDGQGDLVQEAEAVFDATGTASFSLRSLGNLAGSPPVVDPFQDPPENPFDPLWKRPNFVGVRVWSHDTLVRSKPATFAAFTTDAAAMAALMAAELGCGVTDGAPLPFVVADLFFSVHPYTGGVLVARDVLLMGDALDCGTQPSSQSQAMMTSSALQLQLLIKLLELRFGPSLKARQAVKALRVLREADKTAANFARWARLNSHDPVLAQRFEKIIDALLNHGGEAAAAAADLLSHADAGIRHMDSLEGALRASDNIPETLDVLKAIADAHVDPADAKAAGRFLRSLLKLASKSDHVTPAVARGIEKALESGAKAGYVKVISQNFPEVSKVWQRMDAITDAATLGLRHVVTDLGTKIKPNTFKALGAEGVLKWAEKYLQATGKKVAEFERSRTVAGLTRRYDASYKIGQEILDVEVKNWKSFSTGGIWRTLAEPGKKVGKEALKLQKDIVIKFLDLDGPRNYSDLRWAINSNAVGGSPPDAVKLKAFKDWMLGQFDSELVKAKLRDPETWKKAKAAFEDALANDLLDFF